MPSGPRTHARAPSWDGLGRTYRTDAMAVGNYSATRAVRAAITVRHIGDTAIALTDNVTALGGLITDTA